MNTDLEKKMSNPVCAECIKKHLDKYKGFVDAEGNVCNEFSVPCMGIPNKYLSNHLEAVLDDESREDAIGLFDPVTWAAKWIKNPDGSPWVARWYQKSMLRCTASRRITRCGRRIGKTDAIAVHALHFCFTNKNKKVLVVAPYKSQTEEIISRIRSFINSNPKLASSVERDVSSPFYEIRLRNGSRIRGFSSGTKSGSDAGAVRGQDADILYIDEADMLSDGDLKAIIAILDTHAHVRFWASSTPTGKRAHFWRWCTKTPSYKEFYYPSSVLPFWDEIKDQIRADYIGNEDAWNHEILAIFGEQVVGVFQHVYTDAAQKEYKYEDMKYDPTWVYGIGVDWNSDRGTEIAIVGYNGRGHFQVVDGLNIPKQNWTQLAGIEAVIAMNAKWLPRFIYVDEGYGSTNLELLRKYGYDMINSNLLDPACKLKDIVKGYNFSAKIDAHDPMTKQIIKKPAKPFMVENTVRFFEEGRLSISAFDMVLRNQLPNYIIKHRTTAGIPVYGMIEDKIGDHRLDALMLALVGFKLEMSDFGKPIHSVRVAVSPGFAKLHGRDSQPDSEKELAKRMELMPNSRYDEDLPSMTNQMSHIPAKTVDTYKIPEYRYGFMTDEEEKYRRKYKLKNMRRKVHFRRVFPERKNI